ncbi:Uncharacterised protein [Vibrio cholerae]|nr:Uncharacterised protein [Vibrio cholerae]
MRDRPQRGRYDCAAHRSNPSYSQICPPQPHPPSWYLEWFQQIQSVAASSYNLRAESIS